MQFAPVVLKDNAGVDVVFAPRDITNGVATFVKSNGVPLADKRLSFTKTRNPQSKREKVQVKFVVPTVQDVVVNGISRPTVVRTAYADLTLTFDETSQPIEREDLRGYLFYLLGDSPGTNWIDDLEAVY